MIDVESKVYTPIAVGLRNAFSGIFVSGEYVKAPSSFPHASIVEMDNYTSTDRMDTADEERFSTLMYEVNVYSNKTSGKKSEPKIDNMFVASFDTPILLMRIRARKAMINAQLCKQR